MADWGKKRSEMRRAPAQGAADATDWGAKKRTISREQAAILREQQALQGVPMGEPALPPEQDPQPIQDARAAMQQWDQTPRGTTAAAAGQFVRGLGQSAASTAELFSRLGQGMAPEMYLTEQGIMDSATQAGVMPAAEETPTKLGMIGGGAGRAAGETAQFAIPAAGAARLGYGTGKVGKVLMGNYLTRGARVGVEDAAVPTLKHVGKEAAKDVAYGAAGGAGGVVGEGETGSTLGNFGGNVIGTASGAALLKSLTKVGRFGANEMGRVGRAVASSEKAVATMESLGAGGLARKLQVDRDAFFENLGRERAAESIRLAAGEDPTNVLREIGAAEEIARRHPGARLNLAQATGRSSYQTMLDDRVRRSTAFRDQVEAQKDATDSVAFGELQRQYPPQPGGTRVIQKLVQDSVDSDLTALRTELATSSDRVLSMRRNVSSPENQSEQLAGTVQDLVGKTKARVDAMYEPFNKHGNRIELPAARNRLTGWFQQYTGRLGNVESRVLESGAAMNNPAVKDILRGEAPLTFADLKASRESINQVLRDSPDLSYTERNLLTGLKREVDGTLTDMMSAGQFRTDLDAESLMELYAGARRFEDEAWQATDEAVAAVQAGDTGAIAENYRAANAAHRERKQVLGPEATPAIGKVTGEGRRVRPQQETPAADVGRQLLKPGGDARQRVAQFGEMVQYARASGGDTAANMERGARDYLLASAYQNAGFDTGLPNPVALDKWRTEHEAALSMFPDVERHLRDVSSARRFYDESAVSIGDRVASLNKSVASDFIGRPVDEAADAILSAKGRTPVEAAGEILARTQGHPDARAGLSRAFSERLLANTKRLTTESATDVLSGGHVAPNFQKMQDMLSEKEDVLRHVWGNQRYESTQEVVHILNRNNKATKATTTRELTPAQARQNVQKVSKWAEGARDRLDKPGVIPFGERGARLIDMLSESFPDEYTAKFLERALLDPTAARALLMEGDELIRTEPLRPFRIWMAGVATSALKDMGGEE